MWWKYALVNEVAGSLANVFTKLSGGKINPFFAVLVAQAPSTFCLLLFFLASGKNIQTTKQGILFACLVGVATAFGFAAWFKLFSLDAPLIVAGTIAIIGVIVFTTLWGVIFLGEKVTLPIFFGFLLAVFSAFLLTFKGR